MAGCNCGKKTPVPKKVCPLCHKESDHINYRVVETVVKEELKRLVMEEDYYTCGNHQCDVVFFDEEGEQVYLAKDVNLMANFDEVTKGEKSCSGGCNGGCNNDCNGGCQH